MCPTRSSEPLGRHIRMARASGSRKGLFKREAMLYSQGMKVRPLDVGSDSPCRIPGSVSTSVDKAAALLMAFGRTGGCATLTELAREARITKSTAHRLLGTLRSAGLVDATTWIGTSFTRWSRLGALALRGETTMLREVALPYMAELYERPTRTSTSQCSTDTRSSIWRRSTATARLRPRRGWADGPPATLPVSARPCWRSRTRRRFEKWSKRAFARLHLDPSCFPAPWLVSSKTVRETGLAFDQEETREGLNCIAAPIFSPAGRPVAAISVAGSTRTVRPEHIASKVLAAALQIARKAGPDVDLLARRPAGHGLRMAEAGR